MPPRVPSTKPVTRFSTLFREVSTSCPLEVTAYGACLAEISTDIQKGACEEEFRKLKKCFNRALQARRIR